MSSINSSNAFLATPLSKCLPTSRTEQSASTSSSAGSRRLMYDFDMPSIRYQKTKRMSERIGFTDKLLTEKISRAMDATALETLFTSAMEELIPKRSLSWRVPQSSFCIISFFDARAIMACSSRASATSMAYIVGEIDFFRMLMATHCHPAP